MLFSQKAEALTPAGTVIGNIASATYEDAGGNPYTSNSLQVSTTVQAVYAFDIDKDGTRTTPNALVTQNATPGSIIYYQYKITNNGNSNDNYNVRLNDVTSTPLPGGGVTNVQSTFGTAPTVKVFWDKNGTGNFQVGDPLLTSTDNLPISAGQSEYIIVEVTVPSTGLTAGQIYEQNVRVFSVGDTAARDNFDDLSVADPKGQWSKTTIVDDAIININKSVDVSNTDPSGVLTYTFDIKNNGNKDATNIILRDALPTDTAFVIGSQTVPSGTTFDYATGVSDPSLNASYGAYTPTATPAGSTPNVDTNIKGVRFTIAGPLTPTATKQVKFKVSVKPYGVANQLGSALAAVQTINNVGRFDYTPTTGGPSTNNTTNVAPTDVNKKLAVKTSGNTTTFANQVKLAAGDTVAGNPGNNETTTPPTFPTEGVKTNTGVVAANSYVYFRQTVTNNGNSSDSFNIDYSTLPDGTAQTLPSGWSVAFFQETDATTPANNTSPLVGNNTGSIAPGGTFNYITRVFVPSSAATAQQDIFIRAISTASSGTALGSTFTLLARDYTLDRITDVKQPGGRIDNLGAATTAGGALTLNRTNVPLTESANGTTVSFPLEVTNTGLVADTFNLGAGATNPVPSGWTLEYYDILVKEKITAVTSTTVTLNDASGFSVGDKIVINGQTLIVGSKGGTGNNTITFASGQSLTNLPTVAAGVFPSAVKPGNLTIVSTGSLAANGTKDVLAVVTVPSNATPATTNIDYKITSANNPGSTDALLTVTDSVIVPAFRSFTLTTDNSGTAPPGGTVLYDHILTNTGNLPEAFNLAVASSVTPANGFTYVLQSGTIYNSNGTVASVINTGGVIPNPITLTAGQYLKFKVKVNVPAGAAAGSTIDTANVSATETTSSEAKTNVDTTSVVAGFLSISKTGKTFAKTDTVFQTAGAFDIAKAATGNPAAEKAGTSGANLAAPGDVIEYTINYSNVTANDALKVKIKDLIPDNTTYVPGSMRMGANYAAAIASVNKTDATGDDTAEFITPAAPAKPYVQLYVGTGATATLGGTVASGTSGVIVFRVTVN